MYSPTNYKHCPSAKKKKISSVRSSAKCSPARGSTPQTVQREILFFVFCFLKKRCVRRSPSFVRRPGRIKTVDPRAGKLAVNRCLEAWMRPSAGIERGGGASVPYGGPIVEMDALIGVKCIRCLDLCQIQHPTSDSGNKTSHTLSSAGVRTGWVRNIYKTNTTKKKRRIRNTRQKQKEACVKLKVFLCACVFGFYSTCWGFIKVFWVFYLFDPGPSGAGSAPHTSCSVLFCPKSGLNASVAPDRRVFSSSAVCFPLNAVIPLRRHRISVRPATMAVWSVHQSPTAADSAALWLAFGPLPDRWQSSEWVLNQYSRTVWSQIDK